MSADNKPSKPPFESDPYTAFNESWTPITYRTAKPPQFNTKISGGAGWIVWLVLLALMAVAIVDSLWPGYGQFAGAAVGAYLVFRLLRWFRRA